MNKSVRLNILGNNSDAKIKFAEMDVEAERWKTEHPELVLGIDTALAQEKLAIVRADLKATGDEAVVAGEKSSGAFGEKAWGAARFAILGVGAALGYGIYKAAGFRQELLHLHTQAGVSIGVMNAMGAGVLKLAGQVGEDPNSLAEAAYHVASNMESMGATSTQMLNAVRVAAEGAKVGGADLVDVTNALGAVLAAGLPGVKSYQQAMGVLNATVGQGDMTMQNLAEALSSGALAVVKQYGTTLLDTSAILATFGDNNIRGADAGTYLKMAVTALAVQAKTAGPYLKQLGLGIGALGKYQSIHGTVATVELLARRLKAAGITGKETGNFITQMFGKKAGSGIAVLIGESERLQSKVKKLEEGGNHFGAAWKAQGQAVSQQFADLKEGSLALVMSLGEKLLPTALKVTHWLTGFVNGLQNGSVKAQGIAAVIGVVLAGLALKKLESGLAGAVSGFEGLWKGGAKFVSFIGSMVGKLGLFKAAQVEATVATEAETVAQTELDTAMDASPIGLVILAIAGLVIGIKLLWDHSTGFRNFFKGMWRDIGHWVSDVWNWIKGHWPLLLSILTGPIGAAVIFIIRHWDEIKQGAINAVHDIIHWFESLPGMILHALGDLGNLLWNAGASILHGLLGGIERGFNDVKNFVGGIASWISKHKGPIEYDATLLVPHGRAIMGGLVVGLDSGMPALADQLARTTATISGTRTPGRGIAGGHGGDVYNITFSGVMAGSPDEFAKKIQTILKDLKRHRGGGDLGLA